MAPAASKDPPAKEEGKQPVLPPKKRKKDDSSSSSSSSDSDSDSSDDETVSNPLDDYYRKPHFILVVGAPGNGKSHAVMADISRRLATGVTNHGVIMAKTSANGQFAFVERRFVHDKFDPLLLDKLVEIQEGQIQRQAAAKGQLFRVKAQQQISHYKEFLKSQGLQEDDVAFDEEDEVVDESIVPEHQFFLMFDDGSGAFDYENKKLENLATTFRHYNGVVYACTQNVCRLPKRWCDYCTQVWVFPQDNLDYSNTLRERIGGSMDKNEWARLMDRLAEANTNPKSCDNDGPPEPAPALPRHTFLMWMRAPPPGRPQMLLTCAPEDNGSKSCRFLSALPKKDARTDKSDK